MNNSIDTTLWERSSIENWTSPTSTSLKMIKNLNHDYIVSDIEIVNYTLTSDVTVTSADNDGIGVVFDYIDENNYKYIMYQGGGITQAMNPLFGASELGTAPAIILVEVVNGTHTKLKDNPYFSYWASGSTFNIKLKNVFNDIVFYINDVEAISYKKKDGSLGKIGFVTFSQISEFKNIEIFQTPTNRLKTKYTLYAIGSSDIETSIEVRQFKDDELLVEIVPRVIGNNDIETEINSVYGGTSDVWTEIQPYGHENIEAEIEVRPHNRMWAIYEVQQPPIITDVFTPTQDAFTREKSEFQSINYGFGTSIVVGRSADDIWRSYVQFDLSSIDDSYVLIDSKLRLYYSGSIPSSINLEVLNADKSWFESSITHLNRPIPVNLITNEHTVNTEEGYIEFNVFDIVEDWVQLKQLNNGFIVRLVNESVEGQAIFRARESYSPPQLIVKYYDSTVFSQGRSQFPTELEVKFATYDEVETEIEIDSAFDFSIIPTEIRVHRVEVPLDEEILLEITSTTPYVYSEIVASIPRDNDILTEISALSELREDKKNVTVSVSRPDIQSEIFVSYLNTIEAEITISVEEEDVVYAELSVSRPSVDSEIFVKYTDVINVELEVKAEEEYLVETELVVSKPAIATEIKIATLGDNDTETELSINRDVVDTEILVSKGSIPTEISSRVLRREDLYASIVVNRPHVEVELFVKYCDDILVEIEANIKSDIDTEIIATKPAIGTEIHARVQRENNKETEVIVPYLDIVYAEITALIYDNIETEIDVIKIDRHDVEITVTKPTIYTSIVVPTVVDMDIETEIQSRVFMVDNIMTDITVGGKKLSYVFII